MRNHNENKPVYFFSCSSYEALAISEANQIINNALINFDIESAICINRIGKLFVGDMAVSVGISAAHSDAAFTACRYTIDKIKADVPIWKEEHYIGYTHDTQWLANPESLT